MQRVAIVGLPGAGKTTLAARLGTLTGLEVLHLDGMFFPKDGKPVSPGERTTRLNLIVSRPSYILEGAHGWSFAARVAACDTVIWLDPGIVRRALNAFRRRRGAFRSHRLSGTNRPMTGAYFWGWFFLSLFHEKKALQAALANRPAGVPLVRLRSFAEVQAFLDSLPK